VAASIYLEEFAPQNRFTDLIEVNISNLAAVPSIVFGILGLAVFIQFMHLPQSAPLVGGLVLTLMTLPTIIISTRASLKAVPPSIRDAALGVGPRRCSRCSTTCCRWRARHPDRHDHRAGAGAGRNRAASADRHGGLHRPGLSRHASAAGFTDPNSAMPAQIYTWAARADARPSTKRPGAVSSSCWSS
jgi:phosphate transport system permease protein